MDIISKIGSYDVAVLTRPLAEAHRSKLVALASTIPLVPYTEEMIMAEEKAGRVFHGKWEHSLAVFDGPDAIAILIAYERAAEGNGMYPADSIYLSELAVADPYRRQGIARGLIGILLDRSTGFRHLAGHPAHSVQTNSAEWNRHVIDLYRSFGFEASGTKEYPNRTDVILWRRGRKAL